MRHGTLAIAIAATLTTGCLLGSAKVRFQDQQGGVLVLDGDENKAMQDAQNKMAQHCGPGNYEIVKRETIKVGEEQYANSNTQYGERTDRARDEDVVGDSASDTTVTHDSATSNDGWGNQDHASDTTVSNDSAYAQSTSEDETEVVQGGKSTSEVQGVRDVNEIRLHYQCGGGGGVAPGTAPAAAPEPAPADDGYDDGGEPPADDYPEDGQ
jgi:hypothetical protein